MEGKYSIQDFIHWLTENVPNEYDKKYTQGQIANIIAKGMINFFDDSETSY